MANGAALINDTAILAVALQCDAKVGAMIDGVGSGPGGRGLERREERDADERLRGSPSVQPRPRGRNREFSRFCV